MHEAELASFAVDVHLPVLSLRAMPGAGRESSFASL
jgi:hypothetical protein